MEKDKLIILKKCIGKKYLVLESKGSNWIGEVIKIIDHQNVLVRTKDNQTFEVSIFDLRNPYHEI